MRAFLAVLASMVLAAATLAGCERGVPYHERAPRTGTQLKNGATTSTAFFGASVPTFKYSDVLGDQDVPLAEVGDVR
jgi:hypothetical protein